MIEFLETIQYWHWWLIATVFLALEALMPSAFFIWFGAGGVVMGILVLIFPAPAWELQLVIYSLISLSSAIAWRIYRKRNAADEPEITLNRRGHQYVNRSFTLEEAIVNGRGKIHVDDSTWRIEGDDLPVGTRVKVVGVDGVILMVEAN